MRTGYENGYQVINISEISSASARRPGGGAARRRTYARDMGTTAPLDDAVEWVALETTRFTMGSDHRLGETDDDEGPTRQVTVGSLAISATPIDTATFARFVDATGYQTDAERAGTGFRTTSNGMQMVDGLTWRSGKPDDDHPVAQVSWADVFEFCRWSSTRMLTEAEWERCAPDETIGTNFVGDHLEWTADFYDATFHRREQRVNPTGPTAGTHRVARGGGSPSKRTPLLPDMAADNLHFRVVALR